MKRIACTLLGILVAAGCGRPSAPLPNATTQTSDAQPSINVETLSQARQGFTTRLIRNESSGQPLPDPPSDVFRKVEFDSSVGKLGAYLTPDPKDGKKHPALIWITGGDCSTLDESIWQVAPADNDQTAGVFRKSGIAMMFPTLRGGNENPGVHEGFFGEVNDVLAAADYLATQVFVDPKRIYLGGHSSGGTMVLLTAECSDRFRVVFSFGPVDDIRGYPSEFHVFDTTGEREFELRAPGRWLHSIRCPVFVFEGTGGNVSSLESMARTSKNPNVHFFAVAGADHFDILAPANELIAAKILQDDGPECNIAFTADELNHIFDE